MPRSGPRKVGRYSDEFKLTAVRMSQQPGIHVQDRRRRSRDPSLHAFEVAEGRERRAAARASPESATSRTDA